MPTIYASIIRQRMTAIVLIAVVCALLVVGDVMVGSTVIAFGDVIDSLLGAGNNTDGFIVWEIRLPMTLTCVFVGAALSLAGSLIQTVTANPLASPYTLGLTAGASFGASLAITLGITLFGQLWLGTSLVACLFALGVAGLILILARSMGLSANALILLGIVMNFFFQALQQYLLYCASPEVGQIIAGWTFGNLQRASWLSVWVSLVAWIVSLVISLGFVWDLTALSLGEERARCLGILTERLRLIVFVLASVLVAASVSFIGTVAFIGLLAPHCARLLIGDDQRFLLPASAMTGAGLMLLASIVSKYLSDGATLPVGIVTSLVGVPFLLILLLKQREAR